jgi:hypothetical protein
MRVICIVLFVLHLMPNICRLTASYQAIWSHAAASRTSSHQHPQCKQAHLPPAAHKCYNRRRYSASADTTVRKWLPIADSSQGAARVQFPGDSVELSRIPPGRVIVSTAAPVLGVGSAGVKVVGAADSVTQMPAVKVMDEIVGDDAHDNSRGGVNVINKHDDKVGLWCNIRLRQ